VLLTLTATHRPVTDLGYLLVKHPEKVHSFDVPTGTAYVLYPRPATTAAPPRCCWTSTRSGSGRSGTPSS
jgi:hypothetical protein